VPTHTTQTKQVGMFPCRGGVAPCQRAPGSITRLPFDVNVSQKELYESKDQADL